MKRAQSQDCPLCSKPAQYYFVDYDNRKHFLCDNRAQFQLTSGAERRLAGAPSDWRSALSSVAKAHPKGSTLVIALPPGRRQEDTAHSGLADQYVENSKLPGWLDPVTS